VVLSSKGWRAVGLDRQSFIFCCDAPTIKYDYSTSMSSPKRPARAIDRPAPKLRKCGSCGQLSHDRRTCSVIPPEVAIDVARILGRQPRQECCWNSWSRTSSGPSACCRGLPDGLGKGYLCCFWLGNDRKTPRAGRSHQVGRRCFGLDGRGNWRSLFFRACQAVTTYTTQITTLTSITNDMVSTAKSFPVVAGNVFRFLKEQVDE